ncbi:MAG TPA: HEAT repeat domain-containing protein [Gemmatimonadaceae bacterium]|nr:HEAT repeat domain-containing protein [Gemmatimonadaceae bacterium]
MKKLIAVALMLGAASVADAGKGGSAASIQAAIASNGQDAILAEVERTETLECSACVPLVTQLLTDNRYAVREVAAWWFAKRPGLQQRLAVQMEAALQGGDSVGIRNAADFLGTTKEYKALPLLRATMSRGSALTVDARLALVRAAGYMAHTGGNPILLAGMADSDASVRTAAVFAWRDVLGQANVTPVEPLLTDGTPQVRAAAATVVGAYRDARVVGSLEQLVMNDGDVTVRRNAAWALGKIGSTQATEALTAASHDASPIVASVARASLHALH